MNEIKPGIKSSEFYATVATLIVALLVTFGLVEPADKAGLTATAADLLTALASFLAAAHVVARYIQSRSALKLQALEKAEGGSRND